MRKMKKIIAVVLMAVLTLACAVPALACTPPLKPPHIDIPEIEVKIDDKLQAGIDAAAKKFIEKNVLSKPVINNATYIQKTTRYGTYGYISVGWDTVENATSYEIMVTKADGNKKTYTTTYNGLIRANYCDKFLEEGLEEATIKVKAYGVDETFSLWSDEVDVDQYNF